MVAATLPLPRTDSTASDPTVNFSRAFFALLQMQTWLSSAEAAHLGEASIEDYVEENGREVLRLMLQGHLDERGTGDVGPALQVYSPPTSDTTPNNADATTPTTDATTPTTPTTPTTDAAPNDAEVQSASVRHGNKRPHPQFCSALYLHGGGRASLLLVDWRRRAI